MSLAGLSLETATRRTGGLEEGLAELMRVSTEEKVEERCFARAGSTRIGVVSGSLVLVMILISSPA